MHAHVIPDALPAGGEGWPAIERTETGGRLLVAGRLRFVAQEAFFDADRRLAAMDEAGVDAEVVSPMPPLLDYGLEPASGRELCRRVNEFIARLHEAAPDRILGMGTVPLQDPDRAAGELGEVRALGLDGVEIGSNIAGRSLGEERFLGFFQEAERLGVPVFAHALGPTFGERLPPSAMAGFWFATEIGLAAASIVTGGTAERCPELRLAFSHGAGGFPLALTRAQYFWGRTWNEEPRPDVPDGPSPAEHARRFYYDTLVFDRRALRYLVDMIGADRLLVGTAFPAMPRERPAGRTLRSLGLPENVLEAITWRNCLRFLGLPESVDNLPTSRSN